MSCLQDFAFDILKIDKSFIADLATFKTAGADRRLGQRLHRDKASTADHHRIIIVEAIVRKARALDYWIVAEGIETEEQRRPLLDAGCEFGQGYLFCKPLSASDTTSWLAERIRNAQWDFNLHTINQQRHLSSSG